MKLYIAKKAFSLFGKYDVKNEDGQLVYEVCGQPSVTDKLIVKDAAGKQVGEVRKKALTISDAWALYESGEYIGELHEHHELFNKDLAVTRLDWHIAGTFWNWQYQIKKGPFEVIATVSEQQWHAIEHYVIDVANEQFALACLLISLAVSIIASGKTPNNS